MWHRPPSPMSPKIHRSVSNLILLLMHLNIQQRSHFFQGHSISPIFPDDVSRGVGGWVGGACSVLRLNIFTSQKRQHLPKESMTEEVRNVLEGRWVHFSLFTIHFLLFNLHFSAAPHIDLRQGLTWRPFEVLGHPGITWNTLKLFPIRL